MCFPLRTVAFRGHGFNLLALAKGMSTLFAKNGFSRPSSNYCGVFRHVLGLGLRTARPTENLCSRKSQRSSAPDNRRNNESELYSTVANHTMLAMEIHVDYSGKAKTMRPRGK